MKCWYSNNCLHLLKCVVPLKTDFWITHTLWQGDVNFYEKINKIVNWVSQFYHVRYLSTLLYKLDPATEFTELRSTPFKDGTTLVPKLADPLSFWRSGSTPFKYWIKYSWSGLTHILYYIKMSVRLNTLLRPQISCCQHIFYDNLTIKYMFYSTDCHHAECRGTNDIIQDIQLHCDLCMKTIITHSFIKLNKFCSLLLCQTTLNITTYTITTYSVTIKVHQSA